MKRVLLFIIGCEMIKLLFFVGVGGGVGSACRYLLSGAVERWCRGWFGGWWPAGTFVVNVMGCLAAGVLAGVAGSVAGRSWMAGEGARALLLTGFCGGFTTFSAFSREGARLSGGEVPWGAMVYVTASVAVGIAAAWAGCAGARYLCR
jgi:CrcB protein